MFLCFLCVYAFMCYALPFWVLFIASTKYWHASPHVMQLLKSEAGDGHFACAASVVARRRSPASPTVIRRNGALLLSRTHPALTSPSPAVFSMTEGSRAAALRTLRDQDTSVQRQFGYGPEVSRDTSGPIPELSGHFGTTSGVVPNRLETLRH